MSRDDAGLRPCLVPITFNGTGLITCCITGGLGFGQPLLGRLERTFQPFKMPIENDRLERVIARAISLVLAPAATRVM